MAMSLGRQYAKLCEVEDLHDPGLRTAYGDLIGSPGAPVLVERKQWEQAMLVSFVRELDVLNERTRVLAIGAGTEPVIYWLANHVGSVVAVDVYGEGKFSGVEANAGMLEDPSRFAPFPYRRDRLVVRRMDARSLAFDDNTFDFVYSLSSIEHFGGPSEIAASAREMGRVLSPGGHAFVATECFVKQHLFNTALVDLLVRIATAGRHRQQATPRRRSVLGEVFRVGELDSRIVSACGVRLMQPLKTGVSSSSWENLTRVLPNGQLVPATGHIHPHVLLQIDRSVYTSVALPLAKEP